MRASAYGGRQATAGGFARFLGGCLEEEVGLSPAARTSFPREAINLVAQTWGGATLCKGRRPLSACSAQLEHHSHRGSGKMGRQEVGAPIDVCPLRLTTRLISTPPKRC